MHTFIIAAPSTVFRKRRKAENSRISCGYPRAWAGEPATIFGLRGAMIVRGLLAAVLFMGIGAEALAGGFFRNTAVGGISIDAEGVLREPSVEATQSLRQALQERLQAVPTDMGPMQLRKISLRQLEAALQQAVDRDLGALPDELKYLAGIQRVEYVLVYPEQQDIVLAGPGEGWTINEQGAIVGQTTGRPVILLEDLLVALQATPSSRETGISCSIDPTEEGVRAMREYVKRQRRFAPNVLDGIAQSLGAQQVTITGVSDTSHFARVLVAADYRMKRIGMQLEHSPVPELPSFLELLAQSRFTPKNMMPRWWLACNYEPLARDADGLAWQLRGQGVKVMTEDDFVSDQGQANQTGDRNPIAVRWAELMNEHYGDLVEKQAVFGQLRNVMDLCIIAALIDQQQLLQKAGCALPILTGKNGDFAQEAWNPPKTISTQCSVIKRGNDYIITASGGVQIDAYRYARESEANSEVTKLRTQTTHQADRWWWN